MTNPELETRTKRFALRCLTLADALPKPAPGRAISGQIARSGTSIGANYRAADRARSAAEWYSKICIVVEECDETAYWLELVIEAEMLGSQKVTPLHQEAIELVAIFAASRKTAKN